MSTKVTTWAEVEELYEADAPKVDVMEAARALLASDEADIDDRKLAAVMLHEECDPDDITLAKYDYCGMPIFEVHGREFAVGTDEEADAAARQYIEDSLWAFNASFLAGLTEMPEEVFTALGSKCEDGNEAVRRIVDKTCGLDELVDQATSADGRAHFLSTYDGDEHEYSNDLYLYRIN